LEKEIVSLSFGDELGAEKNPIYPVKRSK